MSEMMPSADPMRRLDLTSTGRFSIDRVREQRGLGFQFSYGDTPIIQYFLAKNTKFTLFSPAKICVEMNLSERVDELWPHTDLGWREKRRMNGATGRNRLLKQREKGGRL
jgi:hypothetical protein